MSRQEILSNDQGMAKMSLCSKSTLSLSRSGFGLLLHLGYEAGRFLVIRMTPLFFPSLIKVRSVMALVGVVFSIIMSPRSSWGLDQIEPVWSPTSPWSSWQLGAGGSPCLALSTTRSSTCK
jgi:hypothetical protein